jgi:short subunit dehydrogenase-like uncharacterized protein
MSATSARSYDILLFGATGFTGGKTAEYLARHAPAGLRWAIAGRSQPKLDAVKARLVAIDPRHSAVGTVQASVDDPTSLQRMAAQTRVLVTTVGPFIDYGEPVVKACIEQRTDYIDSTGEPFFVQLLLGRYADAAANSGVRIVPSCGFDSIPADLGVFFTVQQLPSDQPISISGYLSLDAKFSGGTERSAILSSVTPPGLPKLPKTAASDGRRVSLRTSKVERLPALDAWTTPLPTIDGSVVLRSASTIARYGPDFSYSHNAQHASLGHVVGAFAFFGTVALFVRVPPLRALLLKVAKKSGEGPSEAQMSKSWFKLRFFAESAGKTIETEVSGGDPGYGETSKMLAESAMCLAQDRESLPKRVGILTPAEAMGAPLLARLQHAGMIFRVV